ncbi:hypothetical protein, partial [Pseudomonas sp. MWU12-2323]|uniref:hypothetical protein n=1 Tax=Pseudomonas sp. MWU12-2323 TaxID=2651296 RepID=UPI001C49A7A6
MSLNKNVSDKGHFGGNALPEKTCEEILHDEVTSPNVAASNESSCLSSVCRAYEMPSNVLVISARRLL